MSLLPPTSPLKPAAPAGTRTRSATGVNIGLPSPTGSTSETSDYQRSTPSPQEDSEMGSVEDWSSEVQTPRPGDDAEDHGFSEAVKKRLAPPSQSEKEVAESAVIDPRLMLQQVRVALEKIPIDKSKKVIKRRHSDGPEEKFKVVDDNAKR